MQCTSQKREHPLGVPPLLLEAVIGYSADEEDPRQTGTVPDLVAAERVFGPCRTRLRLNACSAERVWRAQRVWQRLYHGVRQCSATYKLLFSVQLSPCSYVRQASKVPDKQSAEISSRFKECPIAKSQRQLYVWVARANKDDEPRPLYTMDLESMVKLRRYREEAQNRCDICGSRCAICLYEFRCYLRERKGTRSWDDRRLRSKQSDPNPKESFLMRKETST